jgi:hypothetical protein
MEREPEPVEVRERRSWAGAQDEAGADDEQPEPAGRQE